MKKGSNSNMLTKKPSAYGHVMERRGSTTMAPPSISPSGSQIFTKKTRPSQSVTKDADSILVTGFALRTQESLQKALLDEEQRRKYLLNKYDKNEEFECESRSTSSYTTSYSTPKFSEGSSQSDQGRGLPQDQLKYLMGLAPLDMEEFDYSKQWLKKESEPEVEEEKEDERLTLAMRQAQRYLRSHKIFEFFQFLIAHLLSDLPDCPIMYLLELLNKCLIYRSGLNEPPLLYGKAHLEQLFYLMDRMRTGFIDIGQYKTGMTTLGICTYTEKPLLSLGSMVAKDVFIEEAYERLTELFHDMIRRRRGKSSTPSMVTPLPTLADLDTTTTTTYSDLRRKTFRAKSGADE